MRPQVVSQNSGHIIGEGAMIFMDMTETMLDALDWQMALSAKAQEPESSLTLFFLPILAGFCLCCCFYLAELPWLHSLSLKFIAVGFCCVPLHDGMVVHVAVPSHPYDFV